MDIDNNFKIYHIGGYVVVYGKNAYANSAGMNNEFDWSCTCPDWQFRRRKNGGYCKHIEKIIKEKKNKGA